jgi:uncharacterized membrane protein YhiD involved in acid resistance
VSGHLTALEFVLRLATGSALGIAIGFERQWRQRSAGLHTAGVGGGRAAHRPQVVSRP